MPDEELNRYFAALSADADAPMLAEASMLKQVAARRARTQRIAGAGAACLAVAAAATTVVALRPAAAGGRVDPGGPTATGTGPVVATSGPATGPSATPAPGPSSASPRPSGTGPANPPTQATTSSAPPGSQPCRATDFGTVTAQGDSALGMIAYDILIPVVHRCTLPALPTVHLVDPAGGSPVLLTNGNPFGAPLGTKPVPVRPGMTATFSINEVDGTVRNPPPASCAKPATYQKIIIQMPGTDLVGTNLNMYFPCRYPQAGNWAAN